MIFHGTGPKAYGLKRMLAALKTKGLVPDKSGMFVVDRDAGLTSLDVETLYRCCDQYGFDWKYSEDVA